MKQIILTIPVTISLKKNLFIDIPQDSQYKIKIIETVYFEPRWKFSEITKSKLDMICKDYFNLVKKITGKNLVNLNITFNPNNLVIELLLNQTKYKNKLISELIYISNLFFDKLIKFPAIGPRL